MFNPAPTLPPMRYRLWLPQLGLYVREADPINPKFIGSDNRERAAVLLEPEARQLAIQLIRLRDLVVELRPTGEATQ